jgi:pyridinium-3,5-biscarboxylic acid mononucleotide synthase
MPRTKSKATSPTRIPEPRPYTDLGFARVDNLRQVRTGFPEVIYAEGKTQAQIVKIASALVAEGFSLLITRLENAAYIEIRKSIRGLKYHAQARCAFLAEASVVANLPLLLKSNGMVTPDFTAIKTPKAPPEVLVITGGTTDIPTAEEAGLTAALMGCQVDRLFDVGVAGLHRLLSQVHRLEDPAAIVVAAGMDAALASVVTGLTRKPVIGLPTPTGYGYGGQGEAALMAMLQACAPGLTVVNIGNGFGAGFAAAQIALQVRAAKTP